MNEEIDKAIKLLVAQVAKPGVNPKSEDTIRFSQSVLNLAHAKSILLPLENAKTKGAGS